MGVGWGRDGNVREKREKRERNSAFKLTRSVSPASHKGLFCAEFIEERRKGLEAFINKCVVNEWSRGNPEGERQGRRERERGVER